MPLLLAHTALHDTVNTLFTALRESLSLGTPWIGTVDQKNREVKGSNEERCGGGVGRGDATQGKYFTAPYCFVTEAYCRLLTEQPLHLSHREDHSRILRHYEGPGVKV